MKEIVTVSLENEMDLILAHKRAMKLCELTGFSLIAQTSIATAFSEIARCAIDHGKNAVLTLGIEQVHGRKMLKGVVHDTADFSNRCIEACTYAKRLVHDIETVRSPKEIRIIVRHPLGFSGTLTDAKIQSFVDYFKNEPALSAYDEIRRKNQMLQDLADKIRESEEDYRLLTDNLPLMMFSANNRGVITYANKWLNDFLGAAPKDLASASWHGFLSPMDATTFSKGLNNAVLRQLPFNGQCRFRKFNGEYLWHLVSIIPLRNEKELTTGWIGFIVDINAQKQAEQTLKDNRELKETQEKLVQNQEDLERKVVELNRSNYELEQFAHVASHDLQEPLRKIFFYSDVLKKKYSGELDASGSNMIHNMTLAAGRMRELINDLLSYSQLQKQKLVFEPVDLNIVMQEILKDFDVIIREKNAVMEVPVLPVITGNRIRLTQLFSNLISNALKYSRENVSPVISIGIDYNKGNAYFKIRDNGIGFDEQYCERIFGLFERLHSRDEFPGTGIGLSICKRIVELHGGKISAHSRLNEYAQFEVVLPLEQTMLEEM